jgi:hypothetical protein
MRIGQRTSSETFADFTLSRVPQEIRDSLTDVQYGAIRSALIAKDEQARHRIDIRLRIPLFLRSYYLVLFAGRDRRASAYRLEDSRRTRIPIPLRTTIHYLLSLGVLLAVFSVVFMVLYKVKNLMGINIFSDFHLSDLWSSVWFSANRKLV